jgi:hypothetical protein
VEENKVTAESERWMRLQRDQPTCLYELGVMPHLLLALAGRIKNIDSVRVAGSCWLCTGRVVRCVLEGPGGGCCGGEGGSGGGGRRWEAETTATGVEDA